MNTSFAFDTSALVSLGHTGLIDAICDHFKIIVSKRIISELHDIGKGNDEDASAANNWLMMKDRLIIKKTKKAIRFNQPKIVINISFVLSSR